MARKKYINQLIQKNLISEEMKLITGSNTDYITPSGQVYKDYGNNMMFPKKAYENPKNHYLYINITMANGIQKTFRLHILVAKAFLDNPHNYTVVGHKNNIKTDPRVENLYWTTASENTKKAYLDGLAKNAKGYEDSQSISVCAFDTNQNFISEYGSVGECSRNLQITKTTILNQCNHNVKTKPRCGYYFRYASEYNKQGFVL